MAHGIATHVLQGAMRGIRQGGLVPSRNGSSLASAWQDLDEVNVEDAFLRMIPMLKSCPRFLCGQLRECFSYGLRERDRATQHRDLSAEIGGWELFALVPMMILNNPSGAAGRWKELLEEALCLTHPQSNRILTEEEDVAGRAQVAQAKIQKGQVSRARHVLTGSPLAPKNNATFDLLQGRRP